MDKIVAFPDRQSIEAEACAWIARLDGGEPSADDLAAFREWIGRSPQHRATVARLATLWNDLNVLTELAAPLQRIVPARPGDWRRRARMLLAHPRLFATAALIVVAAITTLVALNRSHQTVREDAAYTTAVGQQRDIALADGSTVLLNTDSRIEVDYNEQQRAVRLLRGEAYFKVKRDTRRPFVVYAGRSAVRAVGTAFAVHLRARDIEVAVAEGSVELTALAGAARGVVPSALRPASPARIEANQIATFSDGVESVQVVASASMDRKLSWQNGVLVFSDEPLYRMVEEVSRYTSLEILIEDPRLRELRVGGYFQIGDTDAIFAALETAFDVRVERVGDNVVHLSAARN